MNRAEKQLLEDRATRNAARAVFDTNLAQVRSDLEARSVGGRIADQAGAEVKAALAEGLAVARESKGVVAGTVGALLVWFFREKIFALIESVLDSDETPEPAPVQDQPVRPRARRRKAQETQE